MRSTGLIILFSFIASAAQALSWKAYNPHRHERFSGGLPASPRPNPGFFAARYDLSGIGWDSADGGKTVALISPRHFLGAKHWQLNGTVSFLSRQGKVRTYEVVRHEVIADNNDISIGVLKAPIPAEDQISFYSVAVVAAPERYVGRTTVSFGQRSAAGRAVIKSIRQTVDKMLVAFMYDDLPDEPKGDGIRGISNDSGAPAFLVEGERLVLFGHHYMNVLDSFLPAYFPHVAQILSRDGYALSPAVVPAPGQKLAGLNISEIAWPNP